MVGVQPLEEGPVVLAVCHQTYVASTKIMSYILKNTKTGSQFAVGIKIYDCEVQGSIFKPQCTSLDVRLCRSPELIYLPT